MKKEKAVRSILRILTLILFSLFFVSTVLTIIGWLIADPGWEPLLTLFSSVSSFFLALTIWLAYAGKLPSDSTNIPVESAISTDYQKPDNRQKLIDNVRAYWIKGVLEKARIGDVWLDLEASAVPHAVEPKIERMLRRSDSEAVTLDSGEIIADVFRREGRAVLILGAPGSGKTMTLLELAKDLLVEAEASNTLPVPVVINLASWAEHCPVQLDEWLVDRLWREYQVSRKLGERWIKDGDLLFLLDGLDEVPEDLRDACVSAINVFWRAGRDWADNGIAVCSRVEEYERLTTRLQFESAIVLNPLILDNVTDYFIKLGDDWIELAEVVSDDPTLQQMAKSPLLVNVMAVAYQREPKEQITGFIDENDQYKHLFDHYISRRLREDMTHKRYDNAMTRHYLSWLATKLVEHEQIVFFIEELQPNWLDTKRQRKIFKRMVPFVMGLFAGGLAGLIVVILDGPANGLRVGLIGGLIYGLIGGAVNGLFSRLIVVAEGDTIELAERIHWSWITAREGLVSQLTEERRENLIIALIVGMLVGWNNGILLGLLGGLGSVMFNVFIIGLSRGLDSEIIGRRLEPNYGIQQTLKNSLLMISVTWLIISVGLLAILDVGLSDGLIVGLGVGLYLGLEFGWLALIQHIVLRILLWHAGVAPLNYTEFLQYTSSRHLTRQVGGGFIFRHRVLMEHFAKLER